MSINRDHERSREESFGRDVERAYIKKVIVTDVTYGDGEPYCSVRPVYKRRFIDEDGIESFEPSAEVFDVPIAYHSSQDFAFWIPVKVDDVGDLVYQDSAFDLWWVTGDTDIDPNNSRKRNRSDAIFYPGGWAKPKEMGEASEEWAELRNMINDLRVAISDTEGVHLQHLLWSLVLRNTGFDVYGLGSVSLMQQLIAGFTALASENALTNRAVYGEVAAALALIMGESTPPERPIAPKNRP